MCECFILLMVVPTDQGTPQSQAQVVHSAGPGPRAHTVPGDGLISHIIPSLVFVQIDWPAPQDKKKECAAKGKSNQVRHRADDAPLC